MKPFMIVVCVFLVFLPLVGLAQGLGGSSGLSNLGLQSLLSSLPGLSSFNVASVKIEPHVMVGLQRTNVKFSLPAFWRQVGAPPPDTPATLDLQFKDTNLWVGAVGFDALLFPTFSVYLNGEMKARKNVEVSTSQDPLVPLGVPVSGGGIATGPLTWTGSQLEWWSIDGGLKWRLRDYAAFVAGLKAEHLSFALVDPTDSSGRPLNFVNSLGGGFLTQSLGADADFQAKLWIPYIGFMVGGANYRASFLFSPFSTARIKAPLNWGFTTVILGVGITDVNSSWRYSALNPGAYIEAFIEYDQPIVDGAFLTLWWKGRWLRIRGEADMDYSQFATFFGIPIILPFDSSAGVATYTDYSLSGGLKAVLPF